MKEINVGVIGFGTVGSGTVQILLENREIIRNRVGSEIVVRRIADIDIERDRGLPIDRTILTRDAMDVIDDPEIHIVLELMGGMVKAREYHPRRPPEGKACGHRQQGPSRRARGGDLPERGEARRQSGL